VESGHDLRLVCRELSGLVRDLMIVSVDPARANEGDIAETERIRIAELAKRFSREDLMRAFDVLAKAEQDIRNASQPRYHLEMALLRWMHLRKLVPLTELLDQMGGAPRPAAGAARATASPARSAAAVAPPRPAAATTKPTAAPAGRAATPGPSRAAEKPAQTGTPSPAVAGLKDALLAEIRTGRGFLYNTAVAQAQKIEVTDDRVTFTFLPAHRVSREQLEAQRPWLEAAAERLAGRKVAVVAVQGQGADPGAPAPPAVASAPAPAAPAVDAGGAKDNPDAKQEALASPAVRDLLDVFPAEIRNVEEM
jgi:DNA polymerase-3 subunit gamma/tau